MTYILIKSEISSKGSRSTWDKEGVHGKDTIPTITLEPSGEEGVYGSGKNASTITLAPPGKEGEYGSVAAAYGNKA